MDYTYQAKLLKVVDGDTIKVSVRLKKTRLKSQDLGFHVFVEDGYICVHESLRLFGINAPEHGTPEGDAASAWLRDALAVGTVLSIKTLKDKQEKYGRFLAVVMAPNAKETVNAELVSSGHAFAWDGKGVRPVG